MRGVADPVALAERRAQIVRLTAAGWTAREIANRIGITTRTVVRDRAAAGVARPPAARFTEAEYRAAKAMLDDGASAHEVARTLGRAHTTIQHHLPGYTWDKQRCVEAAALGRAMARVERKPSLAVATGNRSNTKGHKAA